MAQSKCPKCNSTSFELQLKDNIPGSNKKMFFGQCSTYGAVVGVTDYFDTATLLDKLEKKLKINIFA